MRPARSRCAPGRRPEFPERLERRRGRESSWRRQKWKKSSYLSKRKEHVEHLECSRQHHIQGRGAKKRTQRAAGRV